MKLVFGIVAGFLAVVGLAASSPWSSGAPDAGTASAAASSAEPATEHGARGCDLMPWYDNAVGDGWHRDEASPELADETPDWGHGAVVCGYDEFSGSTYFAWTLSGQPALDEMVAVFERLGYHVPRDFNPVNGVWHVEADHPDNDLECALSFEVSVDHESPWFSVQSWELGLNDTDVAWKDC